MKKCFLSSVDIKGQMFCFRCLLLAPSDANISCLDRPSHVVSAGACLLCWLHILVFPHAACVGTSDVVNYQRDATCSCLACSCALCRDAWRR